MNGKSILVIEDDVSIASSLKEILKDNYPLEEIEDESHILDRVKSDARPAVIILDYNLKKSDALALFKRIKRINPHQKVVMLSDASNISAAVTATKLGVSDFLSKPVHPENLKRVLKNLMQAQEEFKVVQLQGFENLDWLKGSSPKIKALLAGLSQAEGTFLDVLLHSENGNPLGDLAELIHQNGFNRRRKLVTLDLSNFKKDSLESHFWGMFKALISETSADFYGEEDLCGTIYLAGLDTLPEVFQGTLLEFAVQRKSASFEGKTDRTIRLIISVFDPEVFFKHEKEGWLADFIKIDVPALRDRKEDIPLLLSLFIQVAAERLGKNIKGLDLSALEFFMLFDFRGNISEFKIFVEQAVYQAEGEFILLKDLPILPEDLKGFFINKIFTQGNLEYAHVRSCLEKEITDLILAKANGSQEKAARFLELPKSVLAQKSRGFEVP